MELIFRETLPSDVEGLFSVRALGFCNGDAATGEVLVLAVLPEYECKGVGTRLLAYVAEWLKTSGVNSPYGSQRRRTRERGPMVFIARTDGVRMVRLTSTMTKFSCSSWSNPSPVSAPQFESDRCSGGFQRGQFLGQAPYIVTAIAMRFN
jgi:hypothetical protein